MLPAEAVAFKIASADWHGLNLGAALSAAPLAPGADAARLVPMGDNLQLVAGQAGRYRLRLQADDPLRPRLQVERLAD